MVGSGCLRYTRCPALHSDLDGRVWVDKVRRCWFGTGVNSDGEYNLHPATLLPSRFHHPSLAYSTRPLPHPQPIQHPRRFPLPDSTTERGSPGKAAAVATDLHLINVGPRRSPLGLAGRHHCACARIFRSLEQTKWRRRSRELESGQTQGRDCRSLPRSKVKQTSKTNSPGTMVTVVAGFYFFSSPFPLRWFIKTRSPQDRTGLWAIWW